MKIVERHLGFWKFKILYWRSKIENWKLLRGIRPGPFEPPWSNRPSRKMTARSYSCTTWWCWRWYILDRVEKGKNARNLIELLNQNFKTTLMNDYPPPQWWSLIMIKIIIIIILSRHLLWMMVKYGGWKHVKQRRWEWINKSL